MFDLISENKQEKYGFDDFRNLCKEIGSDYDETELKNIFNEMVKNKSSLTFEDFDNYIQKQFSLK